MLYNNRFIVIQKKTKNRGANRTMIRTSIFHSFYGLNKLLLIYSSYAVGVLNNIHKHTSIIKCKAGLNILRIYAVSPGFVLEKLVIYPEGKKPAKSYLGPTETYYVGK